MVVSPASSVPFPFPSAYARIVQPSRPGSPWSRAPLWFRSLDLTPEISPIHVLTASAESPAFASPVARLIVRPPTTTEVEARTVVRPDVVELVSVTEQEPVVPTVVQLGALSWPGPLTIVKL